VTLSGWYKGCHNGPMDIPTEPAGLETLKAYVSKGLSDDVRALAARAGLSMSRVMGDALNAYVQLHRASEDLDPDEPPFVPLQLHLTADQHRIVAALCELTGTDPSRVVGFAIDAGVRPDRVHTCHCDGTHR
jgi:hypothetical protein